MKKVRLIGKKALLGVLSVILLLTPLGTRCFAEPEIDKEICQEQQEASEKQQKKEILQQIEKDNKDKTLLKNFKFLIICVCKLFIPLIFASKMKSMGLAEFIKNYFGEICKSPCKCLKDTLKFFASKDGLASLGAVYITKNALIEILDLCDFIYE